jgi:hypothetical protein
MQVLLSQVQFMHMTSFMAPPPSSGNTTKATAPSAYAGMMSSFGWANGRTGWFVAPPTSPPLPSPPLPPSSAPTTVTLVLLAGLQRLLPSWLFTRTAVVTAPAASTSAVPKARQRSLQEENADAAEPEIVFTFYDTVSGCPPCATISTLVTATAFSNSSSHHLFLLLLLLLCVNICVLLPICVCRL